MKLYIYCAGGFGREVTDTARRINRSSKRWDEICFIDDDARMDREFYGTRLCDFESVLRDSDLSRVEVSIATGEPAVRRSIYEKLRSHNIKLANIIDDTAIVCDTATIGEGTIVTAFCSITSSAAVGKNVAINTKAIVGHDVRLGDHCVLSSLVNIGGASSVGENSYVGMGAQVREGIAIGRDVIIGMGSVVFSDIPDGVIALGNPARPMRENVEKRVFMKSRNHQTSA
jgi:sugar O-acyltransferase (sialic acid O-acetyltransferase NeuD family)